MLKQIILFLKIGGVIIVYWKDWKSGIGGGIGLLILGIFLIVLYTMPDGSSGRTTCGLGFMDFGLIFIVVGIILIFFGYIFRKE